MDPGPLHLRTAALTVALLALLLPACGGAGDGASFRRHYDDALAALTDGKLRRAAEAAEKAEAAGGPERAPYATFLRGNAAFGNAVLAERQASGPEAEPFAFDVAITYARQALGFWKEAAMSRPDWPEARRNVERALLKIAELIRKKADKERNRDPKKEPDAPPLPEPGAAPDKTEEETAPEAWLAELPPAEVLRLFDRLAEKEREKVELRRSERRARMVTVEKDW